MKKIRETLPLIGWLLVLLVVLVLIGVWEVIRWHTFQDLTHSDIGFLKWFFVISGR